MLERNERRARRDRRRFVLEKAFDASGVRSEPVGSLGIERTGCHSAVEMTADNREAEPMLSGTVRSGGGCHQNMSAVVGDGPTQELPGEDQLGIDCRRAGRTGVRDAVLGVEVQEIEVLEKYSQ